MPPSNEMYRCVGCGAVTGNYYKSCPLCPCQKPTVYLGRVRRTMPASITNRNPACGTGGAGGSGGVSGSAGGGANYSSGGAGGRGALFA